MWFLFYDYYNFAFLIVHIFFRTSKHHSFRSKKYTHYIKKQPCAKSILCLQFAFRYVNIVCVVLLVQKTKKFSVSPEHTEKMLQNSNKPKFATVIPAKSSTVRRKLRESIMSKSLYINVRESLIKSSKKSKLVKVFKREFKFSSFFNERAQENVSCANMLVETFLYVSTSRASIARALFDTGKIS